MVLLIIDSLQGGPLRFSDLSERVTGIAPNILSSRLSRLEGEGVISSSPYSERPPRHVYELTGAGRDLAGALRLLAHWGDRQSDEGKRSDTSCAGRRLRHIGIAPAVTGSSIRERRRRSG